MATEVYLVRHGETMFNQLNKVQGWADSPLTVKGINDLKVTASNLSQVHFDKMYSSDLNADTNEVSEIGKIKKLPAFREVFFGTFEGDDIDETWEKVAKAGGMKPTSDVVKIIQTLGIHDFREATKKADPRHLAEDAEALDNRMDQAISQLAQETKGLGRVLVVSHGDFIKTLGIKYWDQASGDHDIPFPDNGSVTRGIIDNSGKFRIINYGVKNTDIPNL